MALLEIYEDRNDVQGTSTGFSDLMTPEQTDRGQYYQQQYNMRRGELDKYKVEWDELQEMAECRRQPYSNDPTAPMSFIPLITPTVEGQVASMTEAEIDFVHYSDNPAHQNFIGMLDASSKYMRKKNQFLRHIKDHSRMYMLLGNAWLTVSWEDCVGRHTQQPSGYPKLTVPPLMSVLVDGKIKDAKDLQHAEYIIQEVAYLPLKLARDVYGDEYAEQISIGQNRLDGKDPDITYDDTKSWTLLLVWTRDNPEKNLQLIEMDVNGLILKESDPSEPYYKYVGNEYPFYFTRMMPQQGKFYGFGDGKILKPMQDTVNKLTDELQLACMHNAQPSLFVDPRSGYDVDEHSQDPSKIKLLENPSQNLYAVQGQGINPVVVTMIEYLLGQAQRATRFSEAMTGQPQAASTTATAIANAMTQGSVGINDKKSDIAAAMRWADMYCLKLCLEKWDSPFWATLSDNVREFINPELMRQAPSATPPTGMNILAMRKKAHEEGREFTADDVPEWESVDGEDGNTAMQDLEFDVEVTLGTPIAQGKNDKFKMLLALMQLNGVDENGLPASVIDFEVVRAELEKLVGFKLGSKDKKLATNVLASNANPMAPGNEISMPTGAQVSLPPNSQSATMNGLQGQDMRGMMGA